MGRSGRTVNFDAWLQLAKEDPEAFERWRQEFIEAAIERAPEARRERLRGLQWRVDKVRERSTSPLAACIRLSDMMWEALAGNRGLLEQLRGTDIRGRPLSHRKPPGRADVVPMHNRRR